MKQSPTWFDVYLENFKSSGRLFQILEAFSECPNFNSSFFQDLPRTEEAQTNVELVDLTDGELSEDSSVEILEVS